MKHAKIYVLMGSVQYENDWIIGFYSNKNNCEKALSRYKIRQSKESDTYYNIRVFNIRDCEYIEKENFPIFEMSIERSITFVIDKEITKDIMYAK